MGIKFSRESLFSKDSLFSKNILVLPKGVNKIIEEYCCHTVEVKKELLEITHFGYNDSDKHWYYSGHFIDSEMKCVVRFESCIIKDENGMWKVCSLQ